MAASAAHWPTSISAFHFLLFHFPLAPAFFAHPEPPMSDDHPPPPPDNGPAPATASAEPPAPPAGAFAAPPGSPPAIALNPYARPAQAEPEAPPVRPGAPRPAGPAHRIAGAVLVLNAVLVLLWVGVAPAAGPQAGGDPLLAGGGVGSIVPAIIDLAIGASLLRGSATLAPWAMVRCVGGLLLSLVVYATKNPLAVAQQAVLSGAIIALLAGRAGPARTAVASSLAGLSLVLELVGIAVVAGGSNPLGAVVMALSGDIESTPVEHVTGRATAYEITFPKGSWYQRKQAVVARDNPIADRWFVRPDLDAHVLVIAEHAPGSMIPIDAYTDAILDHLKKDSGAARVTARGPWPLFGDRGRLVNATSTTKDGMTVEWRYALVTVYERAYYVVGFANRDAMPRVDAEIRSIVDSLKLPEAVQNGVPADVEPEEVTSVRGTVLPYTLTPPDAFWHLRKAEVVKAENPIIDRWLTRPEMGAHVLVVAEQVDAGVDLSLSVYVDNVLQAARQGTTRFEVLERGPWPRFPEHGARARVSLSRDGQDLEYDYAFHVRANRAFQIVAFTSKASYPSAGQPISALIDSFQPPP